MDRSAQPCGYGNQHGSGFKDAGAIGIGCGRVNQHLPESQRVDRSSEYADAKCSEWITSSLAAVREALEKIATKEKNEKEGASKSFNLRGRIYR